MLHKLDIVKGGVAKKDLTPILKHLRIEQGWVTSTNGRLTISTPLPEAEGLDIIVPADKFITAIKACADPAFKITAGGRLVITGPEFRAMIPLLQNVAFPSPKMVGENIAVSDLLPTLNKLKQFIGDDISKPWACGILLHKNTAYATNNVLLARCAVEWNGPAINLPDFLVAELLRLKKNILSIRTNGTNIIFELEDSVWIHSVVLSVAWPDLHDLFSKFSFEDLPEVPKELGEDIRRILPFCPDQKFPKVFFSEQGISTEEGASEASISSDVLPTSKWRVEPLLNLLTLRKNRLTADFSRWPKPCPWKREDGVEGLIIGLKA